MRTPFWMPLPLALQVRGALRRRQEEGNNLEAGTPPKQSVAGKWRFLAIGNEAASIDRHQIELFEVMLIERIQSWAQRQPLSLAAVSRGAAIDYASFWRAIETTCRFLLPLQLPVGRTAVVFADDLVERWIFILALRSLGLNTISLRSVDVADHLGLRDSSYVVIPEREAGGRDLTRTCLANVPVLTIPILTESEFSLSDATSWEPTFPYGGHIMYTSGTTGTYKKILLNPEFEEERNIGIARYFSFDRKTVLHALTFGPWTVAGCTNILGLWYAGGCVVFDQRADAIDRMSEFKFSTLICTPDTLREIVSKRTQARELAEDINLFVGGGFVPLQLAKASLSVVAKNLTVIYGSTELGVPAMTSTFACADDLHWLTTDQGRIIQVVDEHGTECDSGQEGNLRVLSTRIDASFYLDDDATSSTVFRAGFFYPGDMAIKNADGRIRVLGRTADVLNVNGQKIAVAPLEQSIQDTLGVGEVCLFSQLNEDGVEELAVVIESDDVPLAAKLEAVGQKFRTFGVVRVVCMREFPRTDSGMRKVKRTVLRQLVFAKK